MRTGIFTLSSVTVCFGIVVACTQDFDTFSGVPGEGGTASGSSTSGGTSTSGGGSTSGGSTSGGSTSGTPGVDANVDCQAISGSCFQQAQPCNEKCNTDHATCTGMCENGGPGKACRNQCDGTQATCLGQCKMTCEQCAGPQCRNLCP
jgi:hypothetical protein